MSAGFNCGRVTVANTRHLLAPSPVADSSVAGSMARSPGMRVRWTSGAVNTDSTNHEPTNPYGVGISTSTPEGPVAAMRLRAAT